MAKTRTLVLNEAEYQHVKTTLEGALEEVELLMSDVDWYTTELPDRLITCLEILETTEVNSD